MGKASARCRRAENAADYTEMSWNMSKKTQKLLEGLYGKPTPITGACSVCGERLRLKKDETVWSHQRTKRKPNGCPG